MKKQRRQSRYFAPVLRCSCTSRRPSCFQEHQYVGMIIIIIREANFVNQAVMALPGCHCLTRRAILPLSRSTSLQTHSEGSLGKGGEGAHQNSVTPAKRAPGREQGAGAHGRTGARPSRL